MVDVDIDQMARGIVHELPPARFAGSGEVDECPVEEVVLVVVMRDERLETAVMYRLVVGVEVPEIAPSVFVDDLAPGGERPRTFDNLSNVAVIARIVVA